MLGKLSLNVVNFIFTNVSSADGTLFVLRHFVFNITAEVVLLSDTLHEPFSPKTDEVESVVALINSN